jgi:hypothetical protein
MLRLGIAAGVGWAVTPKHRAIADDAGAKFPPGRFVDIHTHLGQTWNHTEPLSANALLTWMDANEIAQAIVLPLVSPESSSYPITTDFVLDAARDHAEITRTTHALLAPETEFHPPRQHHEHLLGRVPMGRGVRARLHRPPDDHLLVADEDPARDLVGNLLFREVLERVKALHAGHGVGLLLRLMAHGVVVPARPVK